MELSPLRMAVMVLSGLPVRKANPFGPVIFQPKFHLDEGLILENIDFELTFYYFSL
jgi:hypothetical protein